MPEKVRILLVEDDLNLGFLLLDYLQDQGFEVRLCRDGAQAWQVFQQQIFEVCVLDVMLPGMDGFELAGRIRRWKPGQAMLILSARGHRDDKARGYSSGVDDYLTKPFDEEELLWKIQALVRRVLVEEQPQQLKLARFRLDVDRLLLLHPDGDQRLTEKEARLLAMLMSRQGQLIRREEILEQIWGENDYFLGRSLDVFLSRIRKYLSREPAVQLETRVGVGYCLTAN